MSLLKSLIVSGVALSLAACTIASPTLTHLQRSESASTAAPFTCTSPFTVPDLSTLTPCGTDIKGHCYEADKIMDNASTQLPACEKAGEYCFPDKILTAGGKEKAKTCKFVLGTPGGCMSLMFSDLAKNKGQLTRDVCDEDEMCAPCINPLTKQDSGICGDIGVHEEACTGGGGKPKYDPCCVNSRAKPVGVCMPRDSIPEEQRDMTQQDICGKGKACVPKNLVEGEPVICSVAGARGVCLDKCFAAQLDPAASVLDSCKETEVCVPCVLASGQGLPGCE